LFDSHSQILSRFLLKVGLEGLAYDMIKASAPFETGVNHVLFDSVKRYCRYPKSNEFWPYTIRQVQVDLENLVFHYSFLSVPDAFFLQLYISGVELTIDMANANCEHINAWFNANPYQSFVPQAAIQQWQTNNA